MVSSVANVDALLASVYGQGTTRIPNDPQLDLKVGHGFDMEKYDGRVNERVLEPGNLESDYSGPVTRFDAEVSLNAISVVSSSVISIAAQARNYVARGGFDAELKEAFRADTDDLLCQFTYAIEYPPRRLSPAVIAAKHANKVGSTAFRNQFGTHAIVGDIQRSAVTLRFSTARLQKTETFDFMTKASLSWRGGAASGSISAEVSEAASYLVSKSVGSVHARTEGFPDGNAPSIRPLKKGEDFGDWCADVWEALNKATKEARPFQFILAPYGNLPISGRDEAGGGVSYARADDVARLYELAQEWSLKVAMLDRIKARPAAYGFFPARDLTLLVSRGKDVSDYCSVIFEELNKCNAGDAKLSVPLTPSSIAELKWPKIQCYPAGFVPGLIEGNAQKFLRYRLIVKGGHFKFVRLQSYGSNTQPEYINPIYDLDDRNWRSAANGGAGDLLAMMSKLEVSARNEQHADFTITLGYGGQPSHWPGGLPYPTGPFSVEIVSSNSEDAEVFCAHEVNRVAD